MTKKLEPFVTHAHSDASNFRLRDAINKVEDLIDYCFDLGLPGVTITDHEILSNHVKAHRYIEKNKDKFKDFQLSFGNEIYLVDKREVEEKRVLNERIPFHHFILIAKDQKGYEGLKKLSSRAWSNSFFYKGMQRVPTYKDELSALMEEYRGHIIATTACVGGELPQKSISEDIYCTFSLSFLAILFFHVLKEVLMLLEFYQEHLCLRNQVLGRPYIQKLLHRT